MQIVKEGLKAGLTAGMGARILGGGAEAQKLAEGTAQATTKATDIATADLLQNPNFTQPGELVAGQIGPPAPVLSDVGQVELANRVADSSNFIKDQAAEYLADYAGDIPGPGAAE